MTTHFKQFTRTVAIGLTGLSLLSTAACTPQGTPMMPFDTRAQLAPRPADPMDESSQLLRYVGQTSFLNPMDFGYHRGVADMPQAGAEKAAAPASGARAEQESDVFKVGKPGSKLLYLLNRYRGLQIVSFENGPEAAKLMGRVAPTGNDPDEMYFDEKRDRLIALESSYDYSTHAMKSRLVVYDVADAKRPAIAGTIDVTGSIADSRIVGDVLYVASSHDGKGKIASYSLTRKDLAQVDAHEVNMRISGAQNMNIASVEKSGVMKYYLLATLSESGWGWWDRDSVIEIVDISDEKGRIAPVMSVAPKGVVRERSQTLIKNDTLIVTSNYSIDQKDANGREIMRIAVETFRFPAEMTEILTEKEASDRKGWIEVELKDLHGQARDEALEKLIVHPKNGIKGRLVRTASGELRKMMADSVVTVGDGSGLSANLQDVRYQGDHLYAFWVPANEIDPFDLFDISKPEEGVRYISRLHFDGWIQRAIPMSIEGRKFILGLGWIIPVVNNENRRRQPQAMIFEIVDVKGKLRALDVAQLTFEGSNIWSNFNGQDKEMEVRFDGEGRGEVLFSASRYDSSGYEDGGQILKFDLHAIVGERESDALKQGAFLSGGADWVRRVFTNTEINRINSFSDSALATFGEKRSEMANEQTLAPVHVLELARNLRAYETLGSHGVQIISDGYWATRSETTLRLVNAARADEEKAQVVGELALKGGYLYHIVDRVTGDLLVMTTQYANLKQEDGTFDYRTTVTVSRVSIASKAPGLFVAAETSWQNERKDDILPIGLRSSAGFDPYGYSNGGLIQLESGSVLAQSDSVVYAIESGAGLKASAVDFSGCQVKDRKDIEVQVLGGKTYLSSKEVFDSKKYEGVQLSRNFIAPLSITGSKASCSQELNIPGRALALTATGEILTQDEWVRDIVRNEKAQPKQVNVGEAGDSIGASISSSTVDGSMVRDSAIMPPFHYESDYSVITKNSLVSLKIRDGKAALQDETDSSDALTGAFEMGSGEFVRVKKDESYGGSTHQLEVLSMSEEGRLQTEVYGFRMSLPREASLVTVVRHPTATGEFVGLVRSGAQVSAITWTKADKRPVVRKLALANEHFEKTQPTEVVSLPERYGFGSAHFTPEQLSFELVLGMSGITQVYLAN